MKGFISDTLRTQHEMQLCALCDAFFFFFFSIIASYIILWLIAALDVFGSPGVIYRLTAIPKTGGVFLWFVFNGVVISTTMTFAELKASMLVTQQVCQGACLLVFLC